jgi:leucyl aminopeptidase
LFDTGGISLKNPDNMHYMKSDMGGATAVLGTLIYAAEMQLPVNIVAILPITDNAISENAFLPSDVITAYNGKTIEVLNTDAEGRMILADGLSYMAKTSKQISDRPCHAYGKFGKNVWRYLWGSVFQQ